MISLRRDDERGASACHTDPLKNRIEVRLALRQEEELSKFFDKEICGQAGTVPLIHEGLQVFGFVARGLILQE